MNQSKAHTEPLHLADEENSSDPLAAIETAYRRIESEPHRNCWIHVRPREEAREECRKLMARARAGENLPLLGIPFGVKDNIDVQGMPTTAACPAFSYMPQRSAKSVERLIAAGAICLGKTNLDQFATGLSGARSPYGSCASVADIALCFGRLQFRLRRRGCGRSCRVCARHRHRRFGPYSRRLQRGGRHQADDRPGVVARTGPELPDDRLRFDLLQHRPGRRSDPRCHPGV